MAIRLYDNQETGKIRLQFLEQEPQAPEPEKPSFFERAFPATKEKLVGLKEDVFTLTGEPSKIPSRFVGGFIEPLKGLGGNIADVWRASAPEATKAEKVGAGLETIAGVAEVVFSPITTLFSVANEVPVLGSLTRTLETAFTAFGEAGSGIVSKTIDSIPENIMPKDVKEEIKPGLEELGALAAQIALGKLSGEALSKTKARLSEKYGEKEATTIVEKAQEIASKKEVEIRPG